MATSTQAAPRRPPSEEVAGKKSTGEEVAAKKAAGEAVAATEPVELRRRRRPGGAPSARTGRPGGRAGRRSSCSSSPARTPRASPGSSAPRTAGPSRSRCVELRRIPDTTDVLALYEVETDDQRRPAGLPPRAALRPRLGRGGLTMTRVPSAQPDAAATPARSIGRRGVRSPANLADILERVLDKGIIIAGDIRVNLLDIELLTIKIRLLIVSVDKAQEMGIDWWRNDPMLNTQPAGAGRGEPRSCASGVEELGGRAAGRAGTGESAEHRSLPLRRRPRPRPDGPRRRHRPRRRAARGRRAPGAEAVVCEVDLTSSARRRSRRNLEDLAWLEEVARGHDDVVHAVDRAGPTAPLRLVTICLDDAGVRRRLDEWYDALEQVLDRVEGRTEWSVKVFAPAARPRQRRGDGQPAVGGATYLQRSAQADRGAVPAAEVAARGRRRGPRRAVAGRRVASRRLPAAGPAADRPPGHDGPQRRLPGREVERRRTSRRGCAALAERTPDVRVEVAGPVAAVLLRGAGAAMTTALERRRPDGRRLAVPPADRPGRPAGPAARHRRRARR